MKINIVYNVGGEVREDELESIPGKSGFHPEGAPFYIVSDRDDRVHYYHMQDIIKISMDVAKVQIPTK